MAGHDLLLESTFSRELDDLARSHRSLWLAEVLPPGPTVVWGGSRALAATLAADTTRPVVLIDPDEASVADVTRRAPLGLRVVHEPALERAGQALEALNMGRFGSVVLVADAGDHIRVVLPALLAASEPDCGVCVMTPGPMTELVLDVLGPVGSPQVHRQHIVAASRIEGHGPSSTPRVLELGQASAHGIVVITRSMRTEHDSVLLGHELTRTRAAAEADQVAASTTELTSAVTRRHEAQLRELETALAAAHDDTARARAAVAGLELRLEQLHQSHSWRATAPLRRLTDLFRRQ